MAFYQAFSLHMLVAIIIEGAGTSIRPLSFSQFVAQLQSVFKFVALDLTEAPACS